MLGRFKSCRPDGKRSPLILDEPGRRAFSYLLVDLDRLSTIAWIEIDKAEWEDNGQTGRRIGGVVANVAQLAPTVSDRCP
jgi:hypothetical protein